MTQNRIYMSEHVVIIWKSLREKVLALILTQDWLGIKEMTTWQSGWKKNDVVLDGNNQNRD